MSSSLQTPLSSPVQTDSRINYSYKISEWTERLIEYRDRIQIDPQFNPIKQLAFDISRSLESDDITLDDLGQVVKELCDRALIRRADHIRDYFQTLDPVELGDRIRDLARSSSKQDSQTIPFEEFAAKWEKPRHGIVFTAHPTFLMSEKLRHVLVRLVEAGATDTEESIRDDLVTTAHKPDANISLQFEHVQAQEAIAYAQEAVERINRIVLEEARQIYPEHWQRLIPKPVEINCWVGYDLDGRTDIRWFDSIRFRLEEKQIQLEKHLDSVRATKVKADIAFHSSVTGALDEIAEMLEREIWAVKNQVVLFSRDPDSPEQLSRAANDLTRKRDGALGPSLRTVIELIDGAISDAPSDGAKLELALLRAQFSNHGMGSSRIHIRINAMQLHNAIRKPLGLDKMADINSRILLRQLDEMIENIEQETVNFASLAVERTTAIRQFIIISQILKYIDADAPIRLLIAECEASFTVLAAVYFAKVFGVDGQVDISPLFETEEALDRGERIIDSLLSTTGYRRQIEGRNRLAIQTGFSDAGRFFGQIPAALAIERLHAKLADVMKKSAINVADVLIFDTHGESMGRGAHPVSLKDRFAYTFSPWVRNKYRSLNLEIMHEVSFQGGDGYVMFGSPDLALATLTEMLGSEDTDHAATDSDKFYEDTDFSRDYFERVKSYQAHLFEKDDYRQTLGAFGTNILSVSGSRKSKRQYDASRDARNVVAEMRAIPHNAILQQMGYLVNIVSGIGEALLHDRDRFADMYEESDRVRRLMSMVVYAKKLSSIKTIVAYSSLFDDAFWVTRPLNDLEPHLKEPCLYLADLLRGDPRHDGMMHLATYLREDAVHLHDLFYEIGVDATKFYKTDGREELDLLHVLRIALIQHIYLLAARAPRFSARNDLTQADIIQLVLSLRVEEAVSLLKEAFPKSVPQLSDYNVEEPATYTGHDASDYVELNRELFDPMLDTYQMVLEIGVGISHHFNAHG